MNVQSTETQRETDLREMFSQIETVRNDALRLSEGRIGGALTNAMALIQTQIDRESYKRHLAKIPDGRGQATR